MKYKYTVSGLDCASCARKIEEYLQADRSLDNVVLNFSTSKLSFVSEEKADMKHIIENKISEVEEGISLHENDEHIDEGNVSNWNINCLVLGGLLSLTTLFIPDSTAKIIILLVAYFLVLMRIGKVALIQTFKNKVLDENTLIVISCIGAFLVGQVYEGMMVAILYEIGKILEDKAVNKSRKSVQSLMNLKPEYANVKKDNIIKNVTPEEVKVGEIIVIKTGEKIPLDGVIISGNAKIDNSSLTGESRPISVNVGNEVLSGSINLDGLIEVQVTKEYKDGTVSRILNLVENATDRKAKTEKTVSKFAKIYTPCILILALIVAIFLPLVSSLTYSESLYRALTFLVISCPCAIAISVPLTYFSGIGRASKNGILIKGSDYLDGLKNIRRIVFDKTGTLTTGTFSVVKVESLTNDFSEEEIIKIAAAGEKNSNHPIAKSIVKKYGNNLDDDIVQEFKEIAGKGVSYEYQGNRVLVGSESNDSNDGVTAVEVSVNNKVIGKILLKDTIKDDARETIDLLKKKHIMVSMFSGDQRDIVEKIANELMLDDARAEMLPDSKYHMLEEYLKDGTKVAFVGDGINDSPVLARSDVGIAMGGIGASSSIEAADVIIMTDELKKIPEAIDISIFTNKIIRENLTFAIGMKILFLILSVLGLAGMWMAVFADVGVTLITILNSMRNLKN